MGQATICAKKGDANLSSIAERFMALPIKWKSLRVVLSHVVVGSRKVSIMFLVKGGDCLRAAW